MLYAKHTGDVGREGFCSIAVTIQTETLPDPEMTMDAQHHVLKLLLLKRYDPVSFVERPSQLDPDRFADRFARCS
jgi:hypothetical protein